MIKRYLIKPFHLEKGLKVNMSTKTKLPNFLIIGAPKAGTTSLYRYIQSHPQVFMPKEKEPHFFSFEGRTTGFDGPGQAKFMKKRVTRFEDYKKLFSLVNDEIAIGEASTSYLYVPDAAKRIKQYIPETKIIAVLRQPVDRAFSNYLHHYCNGGETILDFTEAIQAEQSRQENNWSPFWQYKSIGFYYQHLKRYFNLFEKEKLRIYLYEDLIQNPSQTLQDVFNFLGVDSSLYDSSVETKKYNVTKIRVKPRSALVHNLIHHENYLKSTAAKLLPAQVRRSVRDFINQNNKVKIEDPYKPILSFSTWADLTKDYREDILSLQELIGKDLTHWLSK